MELRIDGLDDLMKTIKQKEKLDDVKAIVKKHGAGLQQKAIQRAPYKTGNLRRSIELNSKDGGLTAEVEATADYAAYQEYGTRFIPAHPYMRPAFDQESRQFISDLERLMK